MIIQAICKKQQLSTLIISFLDISRKLLLSLLRRYVRPIFCDKIHKQSGKLDRPGIISKETG
jgi:hypothetical protein